MLISPRFWIANRVTRGSIDLLFRVATANVLTSQARHRFIYGGIHPTQVKSTLKRVRNIGSWSTSWTKTATDYLRQSRHSADGGNAAQAAELQARAALCFHYAQLFEYDDLDRREHLYTQAARNYRNAAPRLTPSATHVQIPWHDKTLPAYLQIPEHRGKQAPLVVILNGASTVKEETVGWSGAFLDAGLATLSLDTPGSGEAWHIAATPHQLDIGDALIDYADRHERLDARRVALLGISLRGAYAVQVATEQPDIAAAISVTAPFHPRPYFRHLNQIVQNEISYTTHEADPGRILDMVESMSLIDTAPRLKTPLLVVGAGDDLVVPPEESTRLYAAAGGEKYLHFIPGANHVAFSHLWEWTPVAAEWLKNVMNARISPNGRLRTT
ncbi:MAG: alpha/beta hydrolase [Nitrolancea sp.]